MTSIHTTIIPISVITTCYGRNGHLYNLLSSLSQGSVRPSEVIIVNDDADPERLAQYPLNIVQIATNDWDALAQNPESSTINKTSDTGFDIGRNRNLGAARASHDGLIFLDVDCIVASTFIEQLHNKLRIYPNALLMGQPRYLTRPLTDDESLQLQRGQLLSTSLDKLSVYNPYRYNFAAPELDSDATAIEQTQDYGAFWSLCFAISYKQFEAIGGFDTDYLGYGAEDTDFSFSARALGVDFYLTNDLIYHQQHRVYRPPLNHLSSIVINANIFYDKWQKWPMGGWLAAFAEMDLINWHTEQQTAISVSRKPSKSEINAAHYPDAPYV